MDVTGVEIRMAIRTSFRGFDKAYTEQYSDAQIHHMLAADLENFSKPFEELLNEHVEEYRSFYGRSSLRLWDDVPKISAETSQCDLRERLAAFHEGASDQALCNPVYFRKILLISSSRPGTQAANLQGIWSNDIIPPWFSDFTVNINTEMNYWMTGPLNLAKMQEPLVNLCKALVKNGQKTARELLNCEGTACFHNTDIWGKTSPATGKAVWAFWPFGEAWLCRNLFDQYLFTEDKEYLKEIMPILEENVRFCLQLQKQIRDLLSVPPPHRKIYFMRIVPWQNTVKYPGHCKESVSGLCERLRSA